MHSLCAAIFAEQCKECPRHVMERTGNARATRMFFLGVSNMYIGDHKEGDTLRGHPALCSWFVRDTLHTTESMKCAYFVACDTRETRFANECIHAWFSKFSKHKAF